MTPNGVSAILQLTAKLSDVPLVTIGNAQLSLHGGGNGRAICHCDRSSGEVPKMVEFLEFLNKCLFLHAGHRYVSFPQHVFTFALADLAIDAQIIPPPWIGFVHTARPGR